MIAIDRDREALVKLSDQIGCTYHVCDLADEEETEKVFRGLGKFEIVVHAAGSISSSPVFSPLRNPTRLALKEWQDVVRSNLETCFLVGACAIECFMEARTKGLIVNIGSIMADGYPGQTAYAAAKAGVHAMTRVWAKELGPMGIRCVAVAPGFIDTESTQNALSKKNLAERKNEVPLRRLGDAEDVCRCVQMVIENDYINGTVVKVDGGVSG